MTASKASAFGDINAGTESAFTAGGTGTGVVDANGGDDHGVIWDRAAGRRVTSALTKIADICGRTTGLTPRGFYNNGDGPVMESNNKLKRGLSTRHIRFYMAWNFGNRHRPVLRSADAIKMAGPSVRDNYIIGGVAAYIVCAHWGKCPFTTLPTSSFSRYAQETSARLRASAQLDLLFEI